MTLVMAHCIGRASCVNPPSSGRGLCATCYSYHRYHDTLGSFPTMKERLAELRALGELKVADDIHARRRTEAQAQHAATWRKARLAERVELGGYLVHPRNEHGRIHAYTSLGCRGPMCYAAWKHYTSTGECGLPNTALQVFSPEDCVLYVSDTYPDNRGKTGRKIA